MATLVNALNILRFTSFLNKLKGEESGVQKNYIPENKSTFVNVILYSKVPTSKVHNFCNAFSLNFFIFLFFFKYYIFI